MGKPSARGWVLLVAAVALASVGWWQRGVTEAYLRPALTWLGVEAPSPGQATRAEQADAPRQADSDLVVLDAAGQKRLGLAFGQAQVRRIVLPVRSPGTVSFDERRVTHLKPRTQGRVLSLAVQPGDPVR
ncbi:MAG: efflux RND transporter periplasmic adaptor subunit, partial [Methylobacterium organophilum]|nr:efflux RND transporter periplasmic adaptor subunit [Methylobacterium organophilum]